MKFIIRLHLTLSSPEVISNESSTFIVLYSCSRYIIILLYLDTSLWLGDTFDSTSNDSVISDFTFASLKNYGLFFTATSMLSNIA